MARFLADENFNTQIVRGVLLCLSFFIALTIAYLLTIALIHNSKRFRPACLALYKRRSASVMYQALLCSSEVGIAEKTPKTQGDVLGYFRGGM